VTSSLSAPDSDLGRQFWSEVYARAYRQYGSTDIPLDIFNKVWIAPRSADIYEKGHAVYVLDQRLKVQMDADYGAGRAAGQAQAGTGDYSSTDITRQVMREVIIPAIEQEVNEGRNFAVLRQIYSGMLLAAWYKQSLRQSILARSYGDQSKVRGIDQDPANNQKIYDQYMAAFRKGAVNMIREEEDVWTRMPVPRKYFSGGALPFTAAMIDDAQVVHRRGVLPAEASDYAQRSDQLEVAAVDLLPAAARTGKMVAHDIVNSMPVQPFHVTVREDGGQLFVEVHQESRPAWSDAAQLLPSVDQYAAAEGTVEVQDKDLGRRRRFITAIDEFTNPMIMDVEELDKGAVRIKVHCPGTVFSFTMDASVIFRSDFNVFRHVVVSQLKNPLLLSLRDVKVWDESNFWWEGIPPLRGQKKYTFFLGSDFYRAAVTVRRGGVDIVFEEGEAGENAPAVVWKHPRIPREIFVPGGRLYDTWSALISRAARVNDVRSVYRYSLTHSPRWNVEQRNSIKTATFVDDRELYRVVARKAADTGLVRVSIEGRGHLRFFSDPMHIAWDSSLKELMAEVARSGGAEFLLMDEPAPDPAKKAGRPRRMKEPVAAVSGNVSLTAQVDIQEEPSLDVELLEKQAVAAVFKQELMRTHQARIAVFLQKGGASGENMTAKEWLQAWVKFEEDLAREGSADPFGEGFIQATAYVVDLFTQELLATGLGEESRGLVNAATEIKGWINRTRERSPRQSASTYTRAPVQGIQARIDMERLLAPIESAKRLIRKSEEDRQAVAAVGRLLPVDALVPAEVQKLSYSAVLPVADAITQRDPGASIDRDSMGRKPGSMNSRVVVDTVRQKVFFLTAPVTTSIQRSVNLRTAFAISVPADVSGVSLLANGTVLVQTRSGRFARVYSTGVVLSGSEPSLEALMKQVTQSIEVSFDAPDRNDAAQAVGPTGGIDFGSPDLAMNIRRDGQGMPLPL
jgi:hypothetical protein